jgi:signal transduction histidine kinase
MNEARQIDNENVIKYHADKQTKMYHILLENDEWRWMIASGLYAETLDPKDSIKER